MKPINNLHKTPAGIAAVGGVVFGLLVHMFGLTNILHNYDDIWIQPQGVGTSLTSGRRFLFVLQELGDAVTGNFNLAWLDGLTTLLLIGVSATFLVSVLKIKSRAFALLIGMGLSSFPSVTALLFFKYTAPQYGLAVLFSVLAVWTTEKWRYGFSAGICFIALALGIYQAYFPFTVTVFLILLIKLALQKSVKLSAVIKRGLLYLGTMIAGLVLYFVVLKAMLAIENVTLISYQGISDMGKITLSNIPELLLRTVKGFLSLPVKDYCSLATTPILRLSYLALGLISLFLIALLIIKNRKKPLQILLICGLCALLPVGVNLITVMGATWIYTLMVLPFSLLLCVPLVLSELTEQEDNTLNRLNKYTKTVVVVLVSVIIFFNSYFANVNYSSMYFSNRQVENFFSSITTQIHMTEGYDSTKKWAFIGSANEKFFSQSIWAKQHAYGGNIGAAALVNEYSGEAWIFNYMGHRCAVANNTEREKLIKLSEVQEMPCWPDEGSVKVIDEYVVIKLSD